MALKALLKLAMNNCLQRLDVAPFVGASAGAGSSNMQQQDEAMQHSVQHDDTTKQPSHSGPPAPRIRRGFARVLVLPAFTAFALAFFALLLTNAPRAYASTAQIPIPTPKPDLWILKTGPLTATIGSQITYTIYVGNSGLAVASNVTITDQTPAGLTFVGFSGDCSGMTCNFASLSPSLTLSKTIRASFVVQSNYDLLAKPIITNTAFITSSTQENNLLPNTAYWATLPIAIADLELTKTASSNDVARGGNVTYTLALTNNGPNTAFAISVLDLMTPTLPFITGTAGSCSFVPVLTGTIILCGNLPAGQSTLITAVHAVPLDWVTPTVMNTGLAGSVSFDPNYYNNVASQAITITSRADMSITKEAPAQVVPGTDAVFTLTVQNLGPSKAETVTVSDAGFANLTPVVGAPCAGGFPCELGTMWPNSSTQIVMTYSVPSSLTDTEVVNTASVTSVITDPVALNNSATVTVPVVRISDLDIVKEGPATAVPGDLITYTVTVTNNGPSDAAEVTLTDLDPISLTAQGNPCAAGVCSLPDLPNGISTTLVLTFGINPFALGTVTNTASVTSTGAAIPVSATAQTEFTPQADLAISKTDGQTSAAFGTEITYTIVVSNSGPSGVAGATVEDVLPALLDEADWECNATAPNACDPDSDEGNILSTITIAPNSAITFTVNGSLPTSAVTTTLTNTAVVTAPKGVEETDDENNSSTDGTDLVYVTDLAITKSVTPAESIAPGEMFTYTLVISNAGPSKANSATVTDHLPLWQMNGAQWICEASDEAECSAGAGSVYLNAVPITLEPASLVTFTITGTLDLNARGWIYNNASVDPNSVANDPNKDNNHSAVETPIQSKAFIAIGKTDGQTIAVPGTTLTYVITLANEGPSNANGLLFDLFPPELSNAQWASDGLNGAAVISDIAGITVTPGVQVDLPVGSLLTVTVSAQVNLTATGAVTNIAQFAIGYETGDYGECSTACGLVSQGKPLPEGDPKPILNTNPITQAIDVDEIVPAQVLGQVFNDVDGNGLLNAGEPALLGVQVVVTGNGVSAVTVTVDANGLFTVTVPPGPFSLSVVQSSVPAGYALTSGNDAQSGNAIAGPNSTTKIGYQGRGGVSGIAFNDIDGNAAQDAGEGGLPNVVVTLTKSAGISIASAETVVAPLTTTTDANGNYAFTNVPAAGHVLTAQAPANFINTTPLPQNVTVTPAGTATQNLGFQKPGVLLITKQAQTSGNGNVLGADRLITFTLSITNVGGGLKSSVVVTDPLESYLQYIDGSATPSPASTSPLAWNVGDLMPGQSASIRFTAKVSANFGGTVLNTAIAGSRQAQSVQSNEVSVLPAPTAITLLSFTAQRDAGGVNVAWVTGLERNTFGFNVLRSASGNRADAVQVNTALIPAGAKGGQYAFVDAGAEAGVSYTYWLQEIEMSGTVNDYADTATVQPAGVQNVNAYRVFVPALMR
jgi:uncharacterized repeat protein (TIGR01451 family)